MRIEAIDALYVESSAFLAVLLHEPTADRIRATIEISEARLVTGRHTHVEVRRNVARALAEPDAAVARDEFQRYWDQTLIVGLDADTCALATELAERTGVRTLDALHLAAAQRGVGADATIVTLDHRLRDAARALGMSTRGADVAGPSDADVADPPNPAT